MILLFQPGTFRDQSASPHLPVQNARAKAKWPWKEHSHHPSYASPEASLQKGGIEASTPGSKAWL